RVSAPVLSQFGYHLIRVDAVKGDSLKVRHILVAVDLAPDHLDAVEARVDSVERLAADQTNGALLDSAGHRFNLPVAPVYRVVERSGVVVGQRGDFIVESLGRKMADSSAWVKQKDAQRAQILNAVRQARIQQYVDGLRARAKIVDRRKEIFRTQASADAAAS